MTAEEAKECIENFRTYFDDQTTLDEDNAIHMAIEALEKQIPKKPKEEFETDLCPCCGGVLMYYLEHCHLCGQCISWEEDE